MRGGARYQPAVARRDRGSPPTGPPRRRASRGSPSQVVLGERDPRVTIAPRSSRPSAAHRASREVLGTGSPPSVTSRTLFGIRRAVPRPTRGSPRSTGGTPIATAVPPRAQHRDGLRTTADPRLERDVDPAGERPDRRDGVDRGRVDAVGGAEPAPSRASPATRSTAIIRVAPAIRAPWSGGQADAAQADHRDGVAGLDLAGVDRRADAGRRAAAEQAARDDGRARPARDGLAACTTTCVANVPSESAGERLAVRAVRIRGGWRQRVRARRGDRAGTTARAARHRPREQDRTPGARPSTPGPTASTTPAPSWPRSIGQRRAPVPVRDRPVVGVAQAVGGDGDPDLAGPGSSTTIGSSADPAPAARTTTPVASTVAIASLLSRRAAAHASVSADGRRALRDSPRRARGRVRRRARDHGQRRLRLLHARRGERDRRPLRGALPRRRVGRRAAPARARRRRGAARRPGDRPLDGCGGPASCWSGTWTRCSTRAPRPSGRSAIEGGIARGPGVSDMKGGLLAGFFAVEALQAAGVDAYGRSRTSATRTRRSVAVLRPGDPRARARARRGVRARGRPGERRHRLGPQGRHGLRRRVLGRAAHAGVEPERGRHAVLQAAHQ